LLARKRRCAVDVAPDQFQCCGTQTHWP
jgi:hypothetical protein